MNVMSIIEQDQILVAQNTKDENTLNMLACSMHTTVRRTVAKNSLLTKQVLEELCMDPSMNVTYIANKFCKNPMIKRDIHSDDPCVICDVNEKDYIFICKDCNKNLYKKRS